MFSFLQLCSNIDTDENDYYYLQNSLLDNSTS